MISSLKGNFSQSSASFFSNDFIPTSPCKTKTYSDCVPTSTTTTTYSDSISDRSAQEYLEKEQDAVRDVWRLAPTERREYDKQTRTHIACLVKRQSEARARCAAACHASNLNKKRRTLRNRAKK